MNGKQLKKVNRVRNTILTHLDKVGWGWDRNISNLLDQLDFLLRRA